MTATATRSHPRTRVTSAGALTGARIAGTERWARLAPALAAALLAACYVIVSPPTRDLAAHLFRAHLFTQQGFGLWNNGWYDGHHILGYSVLFPAVSALLTPQLAAALAATATAALFEPLARRHFGPHAWLGALAFGAATAINLYTGRLALAFGTLPALGVVVALDRDRPLSAGGLALLSALCSPVAALFAALAAGAHALAALRRSGRPARALPGVLTAIAALAPIGALAVAFPEGGTEPFELGTLLPVLVICAVALVAVPREAESLRAGIALYALATLAVYVVPSPIGSNVVRLGTLMAAPLAALIWWRRRPVLLALCAVPLLYVGWQAPVSDVAALSGDPATSAAYYQPLLRFLKAQPGGRDHAFRIEIPFTDSHWEAYRVAPSVPLARGWERQLDRADNPLFYDGRLSTATYERWLHSNAIRFVALPDAALDASAQREAALIRAGQPYLRPVMRSAHWRVYAVADPTPIAQGVATVRALGSDWVALDVHRLGTALLHVRFTPYWALAGGAGCVAPAAGDATQLTMRRAGPVRLVMRFAPGRIGATSPRCF
ncbi:MAG TPA: hypothetical protein VHV28_02010 [Solirubrobacteraceae bacterium]|nr:hypothetical protein [Solirubrobacteraceae bacterium]